MYELEGTAASLFVILMLGFFPLFYQDSYFNITDAKRMFFYFCGAGLLVLTVLLAGAGYLQDWRATGNKELQGSKKKGKEILKNIPITSWFAYGFALAVLIATVFSVNPFESFYGTDGRKLGAIAFLLCIAVYLILGKFLQPGIWMAWIFLKIGRAHV